MDNQKNGSSPAQVYLQPIAAPSILGLYAFAGSTLIVAAELAGWYGSPQTPQYLFPFAAAFGGVAQFAAGMWAYKARDAIATAMHGMWGSFWIGFGILQLMFATGTVPEPQGPFPALGFWFIALAWITIMGAIAATAENVALTAVLGTLALGATFAAIAELLGNEAWTVIAGYTFIVSAVCAWYTASALMFEGVRGEPVLPVGMTKKAQEAPDVAKGAGEPGVAKGQ
ncbi:MAG: acetate uptake transporter [Actinomycetota bacterium]|nr:acetate uptake transporter [Actinomycetota bacterium]